MNQRLQQQNEIKLAQMNQIVQELLSHDVIKMVMMQKLQDLDLIQMLSQEVQFQESKMRPKRVHLIERVVIQKVLSQDSVQKPRLKSPLWQALCEG